MMNEGKRNYKYRHCNPHCKLYFKLMFTWIDPNYLFIDSPFIDSQELVVVTLHKTPESKFFYINLHKHYII